MNYYLLCGEHKSIGTIAFAPDSTNGGAELIRELDGIYEMPFEFSLKKVSTGANDLIYSNDFTDLKELFQDYQPNSLAWPMMSVKLKDIFFQNLTASEGVNWITCIVNADELKKNYYILRFSQQFDVLDIERTMFVPGTDLVIRPSFSLNKIQKYSFFTKPSSHDLWKITPALYVNESLKESIQNAKLTGISFEKVRVY